jgi:hypothetical protein
LTFRRLVTWIAFLAVFAMAARVSMDTDTWWHLRAGQWMVEHHSLLNTDPFSYTRAEAVWQYPGWLAEVPMYLIYHNLGPGGMNLWTAAMVTLAFIFVWPTLSGKEFLRAFVIILAAATSALYWAARPYLITFVLAAIFLWVLEDYRWKRANRLWLLPVLMVVWVNSHGGFLAGFLIWAAYLVGEIISLKLEGRKFRFAGHPSSLILLGIGGLMLVAVCVNPAGPVMLAYPFKTVGIEALKNYIQEWQSPDFHSLQAQPFAWLLFLTLGAVGFARRRLALTDFFLVAGFAYMGLLAVRNVALFALVAPMVLTRHAEPLLDVVNRQYRKPINAPEVVPRWQRWVNWSLFGLLAIAVAARVIMALPQSVNENAFRKVLPVNAVAFLRDNHPAGRLFNMYNWGGYLLWELPEYPVFVDGRTDLYDDALINEWLNTIRGEKGWQENLDRWQINTVLIEPQAALVEKLRLAGWKQLYTDPGAVIYTR